MKNLIAMLSFILISIGVNAMIGEKSISYVKTGNSVYFGTDLKMGLFNYKVVEVDGSVKKIPNRDVVAYNHNSRLFEFLPVVNKSNAVAGYAMMEYVTQKSGLNLYKLCYLDEKKSSYEFYVYKNGEFYLKINQQNAKTVLPFFGIRVV